jgi:PAS domain S-box-containing protein
MRDHPTLKSSPVFPVNPDLGRIFFENTSDPIVIFTPEYRIIYVNPAFISLTGFQFEELVDQSCPFPFQTQEIPADYTILTPTGQTSHQEQVWKKKDGQTLRVEVTPVPVKKGKTLKLIVCLCKIINEPEKLESDLRSSEEKFSKLLNAIPIPIAISALPSGIIEDVNDSFLKASGFSRNEIVGHPGLELKWRDTISRDRAFKILLEKGRFNDVEISLDTKKGKTRTSLLNAEIVSFAEKSYMVSASVDITGRKKAEEALKESEAFNARLLHDAPNPIMVAGFLGKIRYVNPALEKLTGYSAAELIGKKPPFPWWPEDKYEQYAREKMALLKEASSFGERLFHNKRGERFWADVTLQSIREKGCPKFILANWVDITERKKMEERIIDLYLKEKLQREELQEESNARGIFIKALAHELRTPVTPILVSVGLLKDVLVRHPNVLQKKLIDNIFQSTIVLSQRLEELLDMVRFTRGNFVLHTRPLDVRPFIEEIASRYKLPLYQKNQHLSLSVPENLPGIEADPSRLEKVFYNLLSIAAKFCPYGGILELSVAPRQDQLLISLKDNGEAISAEDQKKLFKPYHKVEQDRQQFPGLGLVLAVTKEIIEAHGGKIWVKSQPGEGNTFFFFIPLKTAIVNDREKVALA